MGTLAQEMELVVKSMIAEGIGFEEAIRHLEAKYIREVLIRHRANQVKAARDLQMHRNTLNRKIVELRIDLAGIERLCGKRPVGARAHRCRERKMA